MLRIDAFIEVIDQGLRTVFASAHSKRTIPGDALPEAELGVVEQRHAAALMRVNHSGEVCAQALYQGQALTARDPQARAALEIAAREETEHLAWTEQRIRELGGRQSLLNPVWYAGSIAIGAFAGAIGDRWSLGFLAETEQQVVSHLESHLSRLPKNDQKSRAVVVQMQEDEARHATTAIDLGGSVLPAPVKLAMQLSSRVMTTLAYRL